VKTIWIINQYAGSPLHGMNFRNYYFAKELVKQNMDVTIFSGSFSHLLSNPPKVKNTFTKESIDGISYIWLKLPKYYSSKSVKRFLSMLIFIFKLMFFKTSSLNKPDIIIASSPSPLPILIAFFWAKKLNAKLLFEVRDLWPLSIIELGNMSPNHPIVWLFQRIENFAYKRSDAVISLLSHAQEYMVAHGLKKSKFYYLPNGFDLDEYYHTKPLDSNIIQLLPRDKFIIGYVGALGIANDLSYLIESAKSLQRYSKIHFVLVGDGSEKESLQRQASQLNNVTFTGSIEKKQVPNMLKLFNVCFISLQKEKLFMYGVSPTKMFDYMAAAKPILYAVESGNNMVEEAQCGLQAEPQNIQEITATILKFYHSDSKQLKRWGDNGLHYLHEHHDYKILTQKLLQLLSHLKDKNES
jgi:glycosyltransferase involved in cell wall biosynthesis